MGYLTPKVILEECLFGLGEREDETERKIDREAIEISSDEENDEEKEVVKVEKVLRVEECLFGLGEREDETERKIDREAINISSDEENDEEKEVVKVEKVLRVKEEEVNHSMLGSDRKANLEDKVMKKSPEVALPYGWEKMKREELIEEFLKLNKGKEIPGYLLDNLREANYEDEEENSKDKKNIKETKGKIRKEENLKKESRKKEPVEKNNKIKMKRSEDEVRLYSTHCLLFFIVIKIGH